jgi:hypothetical protein
MFPAATSFAASAEPRNGTWITFALMARPSTSPPRWGTDPVPGEP